MNGLDLFSGIGGLTLALAPWARPIAYCEIEPYAQGVLLSRMADGLLPRAPIFSDITQLRGDMLPAPIDIIYGGFPCQDISVAGRGEGLEGKRSGLFFEVVRLAKEIKPSFLFLENVPAITSRGLDVVAGEISALGYDCRWGVLSAYDVGAPHLRERWWLLAHASCLGWSQRAARIKGGARATWLCLRLWLIRFGPRPQPGIGRAGRRAKPHMLATHAPFPSRLVGS